MEKCAVSLNYVSYPCRKTAVDFPGCRSLNPVHRISTSIIRQKYRKPFHPCFRMQSQSQKGGMQESPATCLPRQYGYKGVIVGGTFDRLHSGHEILLRTAVKAVDTHDGKIVVGVTTDVLLKKKELSELIEPLEVRCRAVKHYLDNILEEFGIKDHPNIEIVPISSPAPSRGVTDGSLDCIVVSSETLPGAEAMNQMRSLNGVPPLQIIEISTVLMDDSSGKLSSSQLRRESLGTFQQRQVVTPGDRLQRGPLSGPPFTIGLTGGIASGKSTVAAVLEREHGVAIINCDALAHRAYEPGTPSHGRLVEAMGSAILNPDGSVNRAALGAIVFSDPSMMATLTSIVWPAVQKLVLEEKEAMAEQGVRVCVCEAALMVEAGSYQQVDEMWVVFTSHLSAMERLMVRNAVSQEEAEKRIESQMSTVDRLRYADVALYNGGSMEELSLQVDKAWRLLQPRIQPIDGLYLRASSASHPLWHRWAALMRKLNVGTAVSVEWWGLIEAAYSASWRVCHSLDHLAHLFQVYHEHAHFIEEPSVVHAAIFFRYVDMEQRGDSGVKHFARFADDADLDSGTRQSVLDCLAVSTDQHGDASWFHDFTLLKFGRSKAEFDDYCKQWMEEVSSRGQWDARLALHSTASLLLAEKQIYKNELFRCKYEANARDNLPQLLISHHSDSIE